LRAAAASHGTAQIIFTQADCREFSARPVLSHQYANEIWQKISQNKRLYVNELTASAMLLAVFIV